MIYIHMSGGGNVYITKGTCQLFIERSSPRWSDPAFQYLMSIGRRQGWQGLPQPAGVTIEFSESPRAVGAFDDLKGVIRVVLFGHDGGPANCGLRDTVTENVSVSNLRFSLGLRIRDLTRNSVLA